jgi:inositol hexakisphosphate/diphosphoinositol-pentakisphosphate kinase
VCGFDILRVRGKSYVCDVNGWSFVKNSRKYYDDAARILVNTIVGALRPRIRQKVVRQMKESRTRSRSRSPFPAVDADSRSSVDSTSLGEASQPGAPSEELRCVIAVCRHGDRTPKQKMKVNVRERRYIQLFHQFSKSPRKDLKIKSKSALVRFLEVTREVILEDFSDVAPENMRKFCQIRDVLERWEISGINRKLQVRCEACIQAD